MNSSAPITAPVPPARRGRLWPGLCALWLGSGVFLAAVPAGAQATAVSAQPPSGTDAPAAPPDIVKPRTAGPGDSSAGVIHPGPTGDAEMHVSPPAGKSFPTPVIRPQTLQGDGTPVVPK